MEIREKKEWMNGENHESRYESTARTVLRILWFMEFNYWFIRGIQEDWNRSTSQISKEAYTKAFGKKHGSSL